MILKIFLPRDLPQKKLIKDANKYFFDKHFSVYNRSIIAPRDEDYIIQIRKGVITIILNDDSGSKEKVLDNIQKIFPRRHPINYIEIK